MKSQLNDEENEFIGACLTYESDERPSVEKICDRVYVKEGVHQTID